MIKFVLIAFMLLFCLNIYSQKTGNGRVDTDGDGVVDVKDVDDDNDGILDLDENKRESIRLIQWINRVNVNNANNNLLFQNGSPGWQNGASTIHFSELGYKEDYEVSFRVRDAQKSAVGFGVSDISQDLADIDYGLYFENNTFRIIFSDVFKSEPVSYLLNDLFKISYQGSELLFYHNDILIFTENVGESFDFLLDTSFFGSPEGYGHGDIKDFTMTYSFSDLDLDNDGIINSLDLDSDGDGCFDVFEAGFVDGDDDGILGISTPVVDKDGRVISEPGYGCDEGSDNCIELSYNFLNPNFNACDINDYGITIDTKRMPKALFDIVYNEIKFENQISGEEESLLKIETLETELNEIFLKVHKAPKRKELNLKIIQNPDNTFNILVDVNGLWKPFSKDFYLIQGNTIVFMSDSKPIVVTPFAINLKNGVYYERTTPLELLVNNNIDLTNSGLTIIGPNNFNQLIIPVENLFSWDGSLAPTGNYEFKLEIQDQLFQDQFIISNQ